MEKLLIALTLVFVACPACAEDGKIDLRPGQVIPDLNSVRADSAHQMDQAVALEMLVQALEDSRDPGVQRSLLEGILLGLEGQRDLIAPTGWPALSAGFNQSDDRELGRLSLRLSQVFGDAAAAREALATLQDLTADIADRRAALASLITQRNPDLLPVLDSLIDDEPLGIDAIRAYSSFRSPKSARVLLDHYPTAAPEAQRAIIETLATRKDYAIALFRALDRGELAREAIPAHASRNLSKLLGKRFAAKYGIPRLSGDKEVQIAFYKKMAKPAALGSASAARGRAVYQRVCMACHQMHGEGGSVGPDLTGSNRADLDYLLLNIIDPSGDIADAYKLVTITTKDGQVLAGSVTGEDDGRVELSMVGQRRTVLKSDIHKREVAPVSMMPEGLLQTLSQEEVLDLFKYMQARDQVELPE